MSACPGDCEYVLDMVEGVKVWTLVANRCGDTPNSSSGTTDPNSSSGTTSPDSSSGTTDPNSSMGTTTGTGTTTAYAHTCEFCPGGVADEYLLTAQTGAATVNTCAVCPSWLPPSGTAFPIVLTQFGPGLCAWSSNIIPDCDPAVLTGFWRMTVTNPGGVPTTTVYFDHSGTSGQVIYQATGCPGSLALPLVFNTMPECNWPSEIVLTPR